MGLPKSMGPGVIVPPCPPLSGPDCSRHSERFVISCMPIPERLLKSEIINVVIVVFEFEYDWHRWAPIANPLISEASIFICGLAVPLTFKNVNGLIIEANFFRQSANPLEKK